jgi:hypothetical protein
MAEEQLTREQADVLDRMAKGWRLEGESDSRYRMEGEWQVRELLTRFRIHPPQGLANASAQSVGHNTVNQLVLGYHIRLEA